MMDCFHFAETNNQQRDIHCEGFSQTWDSLEMSYLS